MSLTRVPPEKGEATQGIIWDFISSGAFVNSINKVQVIQRYTERRGSYPRRATVRLLLALC
jgi:hypothetical protein